MKPYKPRYGRWEMEIGRQNGCWAVLSKTKTKGSKSSQVIKNQSSNALR
jgi:hypothetical protein